MTIRGSKGGSSNSRTPVEQPDTLTSNATVRMLLALSEGETENISNDELPKRVYLDGTPIANEDGSINIPNVKLEFRPGTPTQEPISGFPAVESETRINVDLKAGVPWIRNITNTEIDAVRVRMNFRMVRQLSNGDRVGGEIAYKIEYRKIGDSAYKSSFDGTISGKQKDNYERDHRIDLPKSSTGWQIRVTRTTPDSTSDTTVLNSGIVASTEIVDARVRYGWTSLLFVSFDAKSFDSIPKIAIKMKGRKVKIPSNYNPETREYSGTWDGTFKLAYTNNPAWHVYDIALHKRFGLGRRIPAQFLDKWTMYRISQRCDEKITNVDGTQEHRHQSDIYIQKRSDAWIVIRDLVSIFNGIVSYGNQRLQVAVDQPASVRHTVTNDEVVDGRFQYSYGSKSNRKGIAHVSYDDPASHYKTNVTVVQRKDLVERYGVEPIEMSGIGLTRETEAQRRGLWGILSNINDRQVSYRVGLSGIKYIIGDVIAVANKYVQGGQFGGRVIGVSANGKTITLDRVIPNNAVVGDLFLTRKAGTDGSYSVPITAIAKDRLSLTVGTALEIELGEVYLLDCQAIAPEFFRVTNIKYNEQDNNFTVTALQYSLSKHAEVDTGARIEERPTSLIPTGALTTPESVNVEGYSSTDQGRRVANINISWAGVKNAVTYDVQIRRSSQAAGSWDNGWTNLPSQATTSTDMHNLMIGTYQARVRAVGRDGNTSIWKESNSVFVDGKRGAIPALVGLAGSGIVKGILWTWRNDGDTSDMRNVELQYRQVDDNGKGFGSFVAMASVTYPAVNYSQMGLSFGQRIEARARYISSFGDAGAWSAAVIAQVSTNMDDYYEKLDEAIKGSDAWKELTKDITDIENVVTDQAKQIRDELAQEVKDLNKQIDDTATAVTNDANAKIAQAVKDTDAKINATNQTVAANKTEAANNLATAKKSITDDTDKKIATVNQTIKDGNATLKEQMNAADANLQQAIQQSNTGWTTAVAQEKADRITSVNNAAKTAADQLLAETSARKADIQTTQKLIADGDEHLAERISQISAGTGQQFDTSKIWYFDGTNEGWTEDDASNVPMQITADGWLKASNSLSACRSPNGLTIQANAYRFVKLRIRKVGKPNWNAKLNWIGVDEQGWTAARQVTLTEPEYNDEGIGVINADNIPWIESATIRRFMLQLTTNQNADNYYLIDWIAVGRPTPGASVAALQEEATARVTADAAEATKRNTLAVQLRGDSESGNLADIKSGLISQETTARINGDKAEAAARQSLQTDYNNNKASVAQELSAISTKQDAQANRIDGLAANVDKKADASALDSLGVRVTKAEGTITSQGNSLTQLTTRVKGTEDTNTAQGTAISGLQSTTTQQGKDIASQGQAVTKLTNDLNTANSNIAKKADASAVQTLTNRVSATEKSIETQGTAITDLQSSVKGKADNSAVTALDSRVTATEKTVTAQGNSITKLQSDVGGKADATAVNNLATRVTKAENTISSQGDSITNLQNTVDNIAVGSKNLLPESGTLNGWNGVTDETYRGNAVFKCTRAANATAYTQINERVISAPVDAEGYVFSFWAKADTAGTVMKAYFYNPNTTKGIVSNQGYKGNDTDGRVSFTLTTEWARYWVKWTQTPGTSTKRMIPCRLDNASDKIQNVYMSGLQLETGNIPTDWSAADGDFASAGAVSSLATRVDAAEGKITSQGTAITKLTNDLNTTNANVNKKADAAALNQLTTRVSNAEGTLSTQGTAITKLTNDLESTKGDVSKKADATAVNALTNRVTATEKDISSQADSITKLTSDLVINSRKGSNPWLDGSFETYADDANLGGSARVVNGVSHSGNKSMRTRRAANTSGNSDDLIGARISIGDNSVFRFEFWAMMPKDQAPSNGWSTAVGLNVLRSPDNTNNWIPAVAVSEANLGGRDTWTKFVGYAKVNVANANRAVIWISNRGANGANTPGYDIYFDDLLVTDVTDAYNAQGTADAAASAVSNLSTKVDQQGDKITAQGNSITKLNSDLTALSKDVDTKASATAVNNLTTRVTKAEDTITSQGNSITKLTNDLNTTNGNVNKKADASTVQALQQTVTQQGKDISSQGSSITGLENNLSLVNADMNNITTPGNLITNATFERGDQGYFGFNGSVSIDVLQAPHSGTHALKVTGTAQPGQRVNFTKDRIYEVGVWVKQLAGTTDNGEGNNKLRIGNSSGNPVFTVPYISASNEWSLFSGTWKASETAYLPVTLNNALRSGARFFDEFYVIDITDRVQIDANATAISSLTNTVKQQGNTITSQGTAITTLDNKVTQAQKDINSKASASAVDSLSNRVTATEKSISSQSDSITKLTNDLNTTKGDVSKKADQTALNALSGRVSQTENGLEAANSSITSLGVAIRAGNASSGDLIPNPTFDPAYNQMGFTVVSSSSDGVPSGCPFNNVAKLTGRDHHPNFDNIPATLGDVYETTALVACGTGNAAFNLYMATALSPTGGVGQPLFNKTQAVTSTWTRVTWRLTVSQAMVNRGFIRPFLQVNQSSPFGTIWYVTDWHMRNITAAAQAQDSADATGKAVDSLTATVNQQGKDISSVSTRTTNLENGLKTTNANVDKKADASAVQTLQNTVKQQGDTISSQGSAITKLTNDLNSTNANVNKKADASALQTLQSKVDQQGDTITSQGNSLTQLGNSLSDTLSSLAADGNIPGNMITNGSFERGQDAFSGWSSTASVVTLQVPHFGSKALRISSGAATQIGQNVPVTKGRTYRFGVWAKQDGGTTIQDVGNTKFRISDAGGLIKGENYGPFTSTFTELYTDWTPNKDTVATFQLTAWLSTGNMYFDDVYVIDITDRNDINANATAISGLTTRVSNAEGKIDNQAQSITKLTNDLNSTKNTVNTKADSSAVNALTSRVTQTEKDISSQSNSITSLSNSISNTNTSLNQLAAAQGSNPWVDGTFETYKDGDTLGNSRAVVTTDQSFNGSKSLRLSRGANETGNSDKNMGKWSSVRENAKFRVEFWAMMPADQKPSSGWSVAVGFQSRSPSNAYTWQGVVVNEAGLGGRGQWVKFSGVVSNNGGGNTSAIMWAACRGATGANTPGYDLYIDDLVIQEITDAAAAQTTADDAQDKITATNTAVSSLTNRVTQTEKDTTAQGKAITSLQSDMTAVKGDVATKASASALNSLTTRVSNAEGNISANTKAITSLTTRVGSAESSIDGLNETVAQNGLAMANGFQQMRAQIGDAQSSITNTNKVVADLTSSTATSISQVQSSVNGVDAKVQTQAKTIANLDGTVGALYTLKVQTDSNGKKVTSGISLGSDGTTSDLILSANRVSIYNETSKTSVPVMVAEGNDLYIDSARIKNGSIDNAKIGNVISSFNYVAGSRGWVIDKSGKSEFNDVIVRGDVYATNGWFRGTVYANKIEGDVMIGEAGTVSNVDYGNNLGSGDYDLFYINGDDFDRFIDTNLIVQLTSTFRSYGQIVVSTPGKDDYIHFNWDAGNDGGTRSLALRGMLIRAAGKGQRNRVFVRATNGRGLGVKTFTPRVENADGSTSYNGVQREKFVITAFRTGARIASTK